MLPREEKTEQLVDTRHEVDQLVLELQKVKQEVSGKVCVRAHVWCACVHVWCVCMPRGQGGWDAPVTVAQGFRNTALGAPSKGCFPSHSK